MSRFESSKPISPGTSISGGLRNKAAAARASKEKKSTSSKKDKPSGDSNQILKDLDEAQKQKDKQESTTSTPTGTTAPGSNTKNTIEFIEDLKEAYKAGLYSGGTKAKAFMKKYNLKPGDLAKLRVGIDQGLGTRIGGKGGNVLEDLVTRLGQEGILTQAAPSQDFLQQRAGNIFEPGMTPYDREPITGLMGLSPLANLGLKGLDFLAGGSSQGMRGKFYGREVLGLEGEELDNFAASVANDRSLYNQMMSTPEMQQYELDEFRYEANRRRVAENSPDPDKDPISGEQGGGEGDDGSDDGTTDPGSPYTAPPQNTYTFFDPNLGRYRAGTYDEYLQYVTAKDGGIIQLNQGGNREDPIAERERFIRENKIVNLRNILAFIRENKDLRKELENMTTETKDQESVKKESERLLDEEDKTLADMLNQRFTDMEGITGLSVGTGEAVKMAEEDKPAGIFKNLMDRFGLPRTRPPEEEAPRMVTVRITGTDRVIDVPMNQDTLQKLYDGTYKMTNRSAYEKGVFISPRSKEFNKDVIPFMGSPITDRRPVNPDTNDRIDDMIRDQYMNQLYQQALDYEMQKERDGGTVIRDPRTNQITAFKVADGGIIGLKDGGMDDMMQADSLMFRDPSDEGQWEYNV
jgi:hypothetical protein